jgi:hypothetical protein
MNTATGPFEMLLQERLDHLIQRTILASMSPSEEG